MRSNMIGVAVLALLMSGCEFAPAAAALLPNAVACLGVAAVIVAACALGWIAWAIWDGVCNLLDHIFDIELTEL